MCGLAGLFDIKGLRPFDPVLVERMTDVIAHRGPDGAGHHLEPGLALGHRRLSIIDLAGGAQPMRTPDGRLTVVFNGEIYNFRELRAELEAQGARFRTRSDTEVLLLGWRAWGERLLARLNGMFAFALWDAEAQTLALARDRLGKKPLHYALDSQGVLVFGSEIKSLLCAPAVSRALDRTAVADFFAYGYVPDPKTIYREVLKLPPGHLLIARRGRTPELRAYWSLLEAVAAAGQADPAELLERLSQAVRRRLIADVPLGALLSGGVDSSAVVALMAEAGATGTRTFSIGFGEADYDESAHARLVAERYGTRHATQQASPDDFSLLPRLPQIYDEPFGDVSAIPTFAVCALARRSVTVALTGDGGDEALAGYRRYRFHLAQARARAWIPSAAGGLLAALGGAWPRSPRLPRPLRAGSTLRELSLDPASAYVRMVAALPDETRATLFGAEFRRELAGYDPGEIVRRRFAADAPLDALQRAQYADAMTYLPGDILTKVDRASMANSLELRSPLLDAEVFAWSIALPAAAKIAPGRGGKAVLKQALESRLPVGILYRPKQGFTVPLARWFRGPLRAEIQALAASPALIADGSLDLDVVRRLARAHVEGREDNAKALWLVWAFNAFLANPPAGRLRTGAAARRSRPMPAPP